MGLGKLNSEVDPPEFGAAADGDADRNMILGKRYCCCPGNLVNILKLTTEFALITYLLF